jgi:hypothetical protein
VGATVLAVSVAVFGWVSVQDARQIIARIKAKRLFFFIFLIF